MVQAGHALTDFEGHFLSVDDAFCDVVKRKRPDIVGRTILDLTMQVDRATNAQKLDRLRKEGEAFAIKKHYIAGDSTLVSVENLVSIMTDGLGGQRIIATVTPASRLDATGDLHEQLLLAQKLAYERKSRSLLYAGDFTADIRWDLLLSAYILEAQGLSTRSYEICAAAGVGEQTGILGLWELISGDYVEPDGRAGSLRDLGIRLSKHGYGLLSRHLRGLQLALVRGSSELR